MDEFGGGCDVDAIVPDPAPAAVAAVAPAAVAAVAQPFVCFVIGGGRDVRWPDSQPPVGVPTPHEEQSLVVGVAWCRWRFATVDEARLSADGCLAAQWLLEQAAKSAPRGQTYGFVVYDHLERLELREHHALAPGRGPNELKLELGDAPTRGGVGSLGAFYNRHRQRRSRGADIIRLPLWLALHHLRRPLDGRAAVLHAVVVTKRTKTASFLRFHPNSSQLRQFRSEVESPPKICRRQKRRRFKRGWPTQLPADLIVDWVAATSTMRDLGKHRKASRHWAKLFSRRGVENADELLEKLECVGSKVIRLARVRVDAVSMLLWRSFSKLL